MLSIIFEQVNRNVSPDAARSGANDWLEIPYENRQRDISKISTVFMAPLKSKTWGCGELCS